MGSNSGVWVTHCPEVPRDPALGCWANPVSSDAGLLLQEDPPPTRGDGRAAPGLLRAGRAAARFTYSPQVQPAALGSQPPGTSLGWSHQAESGAQGPQETSGDLRGPEHPVFGVGWQEARAGVFIPQVGTSSE